MIVEFIVIVPARLHSTRLPRKPLADIGGVPMVVRVVRQASRSGARRVIVAADSEEILEACRDHGLESILTSIDHTTGTDRLAEAVELLGLPRDTIVVNVQGDEPLLPPDVVRDVAHLLHQHSECEIATAAHPIADAAEFFNPDVVKVVLDVHDCAITFSRAPIPWSRDAFVASRRDIPADLPAWRHVGLYAYRAGFLMRYSKLSKPAIETHEKLEQLRAIAHRIGIVVLKLDQSLPPGVDTPQDLQRVQALIHD
ncbi:MAG: 3-deoxy-manno-octulosonate cytidylyltransferase [Burkholderiaceae bacterium]